MHRRRAVLACGCSVAWAALAGAVAGVVGAGSLAASRRRRVRRVCIAPGTNQGAVAEHTFALMLALTKNLVSQHMGVKSGAWPRGAMIRLALR